jgi:hypothetical protein
MGTALIRVGRGLHTMLLTISNSLSVSTGCFIANCLPADIYHLHGDRFHMLILTSQSQRKLPQRSKQHNVQRKILRQKEESTK